MKEKRDFTFLSGKSRCGVLKGRKGTAGSATNSKKSEILLRPYTFSLILEGDSDMASPQPRH